VAQGDRVLVIGSATGKIKATNKPFKDDWIFAITVDGGKVSKIREYIDTQAMARASETDPQVTAQASETDTSPTPSHIDASAAQRAS
jgi:hypothetical protein